MALPVYAALKASPEGSIAVKLSTGEPGSKLTENYVGANFANYDYCVALPRFKGHAMAGYGGAIKNISIGIASLIVCHFVGRQFFC